MNDSVTGTEVPPHPADGRAPTGRGRPDPEPGLPGADAGLPDPDCGPAAPAPLDVPRTSTGDPGVDAALERLGDADHLATDGHAAVYEDVHRGLRDALTALDARPGSPAPAPPYRHRS
ncbi:hypothetical protein [Streptomyces sp. NPDC093260]|uniref:hypothetical protein n=1 Tax=Streptomyces sp. NPDC093260 TaxID=3155073 RepID=UPI003419BADB